MKQNIQDSITIGERIQAPTPKFFKKVRNVALLLGSISAAVLTGGLALPAVVTTVATILASVSAGIVAVTATTVDFKALKEEEKNE